MNNESKTIEELLIENKHLKKLLTESTDINKISEGKLQENRNMMRTMIDSLPFWLSCIDLEGNYIIANKYYSESLKIPSEKIEGHNYREIWPPETVEIHQKLIEECINTGKIVVFDDPNNFKGNIITHLRCIYKPLVDSNNKTYGVTAAAFDITNTKNLELELIKAKEKAELSDRLKTNFLLNMSHEIRTPMNIINGFSQMLSISELSDDDLKYYTSMIIKSSNKLQETVENILTMSLIETRQERLYATNVNINEMILELSKKYKSLFNEKQIAFYTKTYLSDLQAEILTDKSKVLRIFSILINNALQFTFNGFVEIGYSLKNNFIEFFVKDTGIGIKPELHEKIFERFIQIETQLNKFYSGNGLGLSISKGFVEILNGKIWVESEIEKGSTFYFTIPYYPSISLEKSKVVPHKNNNKVLIADDEDCNFFFIQQMLKKHNLNLLYARNGYEAIEIFKLNPDIDLILMDIKMPLIDGHNAAKKIKELNSNVTIFAQSAYSFEHYIDEYKENAFDDFITKPLLKDDFIERITKNFEFKPIS